MALDFFDRQDNARRQTRLLLAMFVAAAAVIILAIYLVVALAAAADAGRASAHGVAAAWSLWNPALLAWVAGGTTAVILLASVSKIAELSAGGEHVALMLGGRLGAVANHRPGRAAAAERGRGEWPWPRAFTSPRSTCSTASGESTPLPPATGRATPSWPSPAAVSNASTGKNSRVCWAHEFSHILNGDMRLNLRLIGIVYGILVLSVLGYYIMRFSGSSWRNSREGGAARGDAPARPGDAHFRLPRRLFGQDHQECDQPAARVPRRRLLGPIHPQSGRHNRCLEKNGGLAQGSRIRDPHAEEISHMFFGDAFAGSLLNFFATHPPLAARIRAFEPGFDGRFPATQPLAAAVVAEAVAERPAAGRAQVGGPERRGDGRTHRPAAAGARRARRADRRRDPAAAVGRRPGAGAGPGGRLRLAAKPRRRSGPVRGNCKRFKGRSDPPCWSKSVGWPGRRRRLRRPRGCRSSISPRPR